MDIRLYTWKFSPVALKPKYFRYYCMRRNFDRFPDTKLGELVSISIPYISISHILQFMIIFVKVRCRSSSERLKLCDRFIEGEIPEFFFDRSWKGFNDILDVYR